MGAPRPPWPTQAEQQAGLQVEQVAQEQEGLQVERRRRGQQAERRRRRAPWERKRDRKYLIPCLCED